MNLPFQYAMACKKALSKRLSLIVDSMGYGQNMVKFRRSTFCGEEILETPNVSYKTVGSRKEGISRTLESDVDSLLMFEPVVCIEENIPEEFSESAVVFTMNKTTSPGYVILRLLKHEIDINEVDIALCTAANDKYLSSHIFKTNVLKVRHRGGVEEEPHITGPAVSQTFRIGGDTDTVYTFKSICANILFKWMTRPRNHDWPPLPVREKISKMSGNVVATGYKGSVLEDFEWRLCFNEIEIVLVENLNDTQTKLYKILKMIKSDILSHAHKKITSYIMKNIVFWLAERYPESKFTSDTLFTWMIKALRLLKHSIRMYFLPYYLIPGRNLLVEKIEKSDCDRRVCELSAIIHSGPNIRFKLKKLEPFLDLTAAELLKFRQKRDAYEMLSLTIDSEWVLGIAPVDDSLIATMLDRKQELENSDWPEKIQDQLNRCTSPSQKDKVLMG